MKLALGRVLAGGVANLETLYASAQNGRRVELEQLALKVLERLESLPYAERAAANRVDTEQLTENGKTYQLEVQYLFDSGSSGPVRILVSIDDGRASALAPLTKDTIVSEVQT